MTLSRKQWDAIHAYQADELNSILTDTDFLNRMARSDHFSRIGNWAEAVAGDRRVLELGCGPGRYVAFLARLGCRVVGADPVRYETWELIGRQVDVEFMDGVIAEQLPYPDQSFDGVACLGAFLYFSNPDNALAEMRRVLTPGGKLMMRTVNSGNCFERFTGRKIDPASKNTYTIGELDGLLTSAGYRVLEKFSYGFFPPVLTEYWWYLVNGVLSVRTQAGLSNLLPESFRVNHIVFAERTA